MHGYHRKAAPTDIAAIEDCETELDKISYRAGNAVDKTVVSNENCQYIRDMIDGPEGYLERAGEDVFY